MVTRGERPSVISALMKYQTTERMRHAVNDAFDIHGGRAICDGPGNYLQSAYQMIPVGITVEGANILTRTLITFAQGALRSHPYLYQRDRGGRRTRTRARPRRVRRPRSTTTSASRWRNARRLLPQRHLAGVRPGAGADPRDGALVPPARALFAQLRVRRRLTVASLGGGLKTQAEDLRAARRRAVRALSPRLRAEALRGRRAAVERPRRSSICAARTASIASRKRCAVSSTISRSCRRAGLMRIVVFPLGNPYRPAPDVSRPPRRHAGARAPEVRDRLTRHIFVSKDPDDPTGLLEVTLKKAIAAEEAEKKLERAIRSGTLRRYHGIDWIGEAMAKGIVTESEGQQLRELEALIARVIAVDHFDPDELKPNYKASGGRWGTIRAASRAPRRSRMDRPVRRQRLQPGPKLRREELRMFKAVVATAARPQGLAFLRRSVGHRLGRVRSRGREPEFARPPPVRGAGADRREGRGGRARQDDPRPRHHLGQGARLHRRRRHPRVRRSRHRDGRHRDAAPGARRCSTASSGCRCRSSAPSTASASAAGSSWRSPATTASRRAIKAPGSASPK